MMDTRLALVTDPERDIAGLRVEAASEGFAFLDRLVADWVSGANRFAQTGEQLVGVFRGAEMVAIAGLNRDPYCPGENIGRLRRLYVAKSERRKGVGSALVAHLLEQASEHFSVVRLRTDAAQAAAFYASLGFQEIEDDHATHVRLV